jgi:hypothetical protein
MWSDSFTRVFRYNEGEYTRREEAAERDRELGEKKEWPARGGQEKRAGQI